MAKSKLLPKIEFKNKPADEMKYCFNVSLADFSDTWVEMTEDRFFTVKRKDFRV